MNQKSRPSVVSVISVLEGVVSFFLLFGGFAFLAVSSFLTAGGWTQIPEEDLLSALEQMPWAASFIGLPVFAITSALLLVIGITFIVLAGLGFIMTWGLWNGKNWARVITIILSGISVVFSLFSLPGSLLSIIINLTILYYLMQPYIKEYYK
ncbi:MAG: DUF2127 domain-containing protein [Candidatus Bathyarchaeota archaeon]|nr:DUF2127 domain-containing protein [Candidatus Bathyarchaeota archaeon]